MSAFSSGKAGMKSWGENGNQRKAAFSKKLQLFQSVLRKAGSFSLSQQKLLEKADGQADINPSFYFPENGQLYFWKSYDFSDENPSAFSSGQAGMKSCGENGNQRKAAFSKKL